jgi:hypothetical protein
VGPPEVHSNYLWEVFCVLFFEKCFVKCVLCFEKSFVVCFEKCISDGGPHLKIHLDN